MRHALGLLLLMAVTAPRVEAQVAPPWDLTVYKQYFDSRAGMTTAGLLAEYSAGAFEATAPTDFASAGYATDIQSIFGLTPDEIALIRKHGFVVSERMTYDSFGHALYDIFVNDMPVYVSSDAILHAIHMSYDDILKDIEYAVIIPKIGEVLDGLHSRLPDLAVVYSGTPEIEVMLRDIDLYLTVPRILLGQDARLRYTENDDLLSTVLAGIDSETPGVVPLFAETPREIDFSQFRPRGHYTDDPFLERYFRAMMWLGRTELYLIGPKGVIPEPSEADVQRQVVMTALLSELISLSDVGTDLERIDLILRTMVGESDNVTLENMRSLLGELGIDRADELLDEGEFETFQARLAEKPYAFQRILSQILISDGGGESITPAAAFLLLGQRFIIDSYVTASVVYDKIEHDGHKVGRMMPSTLDILFALGNDAAGRFLQPELEAYHYARYLAALRHLIDSYGDDFWSGSMYNGWLNAIRQLNPPGDRYDLPGFMQTGAWWQKQMTTQLASWAQLRHDNLLYAKPSYTGGVVCLFPESFVEPIPEFFEAVSLFAGRAVDQLGTALPDETPGEQSLRDRVLEYFARVSGTTDTLALIAQKQLDGIPTSEEERVFLGDMLLVMQEYAFKRVAGWYPSLFYQDYNQLHDDSQFSGSGSIFDEDLVVADVHTQPTDEFGNRVGKVLHAGTGPANMAVIVASLPGVGPNAFVGPVLSYYEHVTLGFKRLTDEEWATMYDEAPSFRPAFANPYLADADGAAIPGGISLVTSVEQDQVGGEIPGEPVLSQNYPNPFGESTLIRFSVSSSSGVTPVSLRVFDAAGRLVTILVEEPLAPGHYTARWDGRIGGAAAAGGVYSYILEVGQARKLGLMTKVGQ